MKLGSSAPVTYAYNNLDQLTGTSFGKHYYDARGNLVNSSGVSSYTYNAMDRLITATVTGGTAGYGYDHNGRRVKQTVGVTLTNYLWDEVSAYGDVVLETDGGGAVQAQYTLGHACGVCDVSGLISQKSGNTVSYFLKDGQGSVRGLTDASGSLTDSYAYGAFGDLKNSTGTTANNYRYTGQQFDNLTGLYSLRARYYNPSEGRFNSRDTWEIDLNNPIELNRYGYTANNPIDFADPTGFSMGDLSVLWNRIQQVALQATKMIAESLVLDAIAELASELLRFNARDIQEYVAKKAKIKGKLPITLGVAKGFAPGDRANVITMITVSDVSNPKYQNNLKKFMKTLEDEFGASAIIVGGGNGRMHAEDYLKEFVPSHFDLLESVAAGISNDDEGICENCQKKGGGEKFKKGKGVKFKFPNIHGSRYLYIAGEILQWLI